MKINRDSVLFDTKKQEFKGTDYAGPFMSMSLICVVYYANYRSWHQSPKIQVVL